jgi:hypothetical protein
MYQTPTLADIDRQTYVRQVLSRYCLIPSSPALVRASDRDFANQLFDQRVPMAVVEAAFALASLRCELQPPWAPTEPIRSLRYFRPIIDQMRRRPPILRSLWPLALRLDHVRRQELHPTPDDDLPPW